MSLAFRGDRDMGTAMPSDTAAAQAKTPVFEVLRIFLRLGFTSFGGPVAHISYFRREFVLHRNWLSEEAFSDLVGLCQFLPGPASSQIGFSIGLMRAGFAGALAAWAGFTLPSAVLMVLFGFWAGAPTGSAGQGLLHGLKLVAVAVVAQAVWGMARSLCPDKPRAGIATAAALIVLFSGTPVAQIAVIALGALAGLWLCRAVPIAAGSHVAFPVSRRVGGLALVVFFLLLFGGPMLHAATGSAALALFDAFYRSGTGRGA